MSTHWLQALTKALQVPPPLSCRRRPTVLPTSPTPEHAFSWSTSLQTGKRKNGRWPTGLQVSVLARRKTDNISRIASDFSKYLRSCEPSCQALVLVWGIMAKPDRLQSCKEQSVRHGLVRRSNAESWIKDCSGIRFVHFHKADAMVRTRENMDGRQVAEDFLSVARTGNFSQSASERHVTQSAFSRRISGLRRRTKFSPASAAAHGRDCIAPIMKTTESRRSIAIQAWEESTCISATEMCLILAPISAGDTPEFSGGGTCQGRP